MIERLRLPRPQIATKLYGAIALILAVVYVLAGAATHFASRDSSPNLPRMGERIRLRRDYDISRYTPAAQVVLKALKQYGMFVADNGMDWSISVAPDPRIPVLHEELRRVTGAAFEVAIPPTSGRRTYGSGSR